jgi:hypothetical protein
VTAPVEPTPGAPADDPTPQNPVDPAPAEDITALPDWAQKQIRDARAEAGKARTTAKQTAADEARAELTATLAKALGLGGDDPVDPAQLTAQIEAAQEAAWASTVELQIYRIAGQVGADPDALLDSNAFRRTVADLAEEIDDDPDSKAFRDALKAKVQETLDGNPTKYKAAGQAPAGPNSPRPDPSQGARGQTPARFAGQSLTEAVRAHYKPGA